MSPNETAPGACSAGGGILPWTYAADMDGAPAYFGITWQVGAMPRFSK